MNQSYLHRPNLKIDAVFSSEEDPIYRYKLTATKIEASAKPKTVCAIMQNPSVAGIKVADKSVQILERVVFEKDYKEFFGVERLVIVNQFALIQTKDFVETANAIGSENDRFVNDGIKESEPVLIAWGKDNGFQKRQSDILNMLQKYQKKTLLQTSTHPSRVRYRGFIQPFGT